MEATEGLGHPVRRQTEEEGLSQAGGAMGLPLQPPVREVIFKCLFAECLLLS